MKLTKKDSAIIRISTRGVNSYLIRGKKSILVDTGYPGSGRTIMAKLILEGIDPGEISLILITHGHNDHFGSAAELKERLGVPVAVHIMDAEYLRKGTDPPIHATGTTGRILKFLLSQTGASTVPLPEPDILIEGEMSLEKYGVEGVVISTPGHTPGSVSVLLSSGEALVGDLIMGVGLWTRIPGYPIFADDLKQVWGSIRSIMERSPKIVYAGHGGPFRPEAINRKFNTALPATSP